MNKHWFDINEKIIDSHHMAIIMTDLAKNRGVEPNKLLKGSQIFYEDLNQKNIKISSKQIFQIITNAQKMVPGNDLSFLIGRRLFPGNRHHLNQLLMNTCHFAEMIRLLRYFQLSLFPYLYFNIEHHLQKTYFIISPAISQNIHIQFFQEVLSTAIHNSCKWRMNKTLPFHFYFPFERPTNIFDYEENLGQQLHFNQPLMMIVIDSHWLSRPLDDSSRLLKMQNLKVCRDLFHQSSSVGLLQFIAYQLCQNYQLKQDQVAEILELSEATLKRKLKQHGTTYQKLIDQVHSHQAIFQVFVKGDINESIARKLQFSDLTNFRRAFKRWTGTTPSQLKRIAG
ncbi:helix-turn-helix domain-containing protein [Aliikangiella maris]|uniref:Helix-turn-helix domain-containing protein n=2 Tax=Aliikangiella maris TaxID=3162458 RepID=A0ABV3MN76_9GAMM